MKSFIVLLLLMGLSFGEDLIKVEEAKRLKREVTWKVKNPKKNPLNKLTVEKFHDSMKGNKPMTRQTAKTLQSYLPTMNLTEIKQLVETQYYHPSDNAKGNRNIETHAEKKVEEVPKNKSEDDSRLLQSWDDWDDWDDDDWYDNGYGSSDSNNYEDDDDYSGSGLPKNFDGRKKWGGCIHSGGNQGTCNGCWAFGIANHLSDRFCIYGKDVILSTQDLLECTSGNSCCNGGTASNGYNYLMNTGAVSEDCKEFTGSCNQCRRTSCPRYKCKRGSMFWAENNEEAKREIYNNGPIEGVFDVYEDFAYYGSGVYYRTSDKFVGVHAVEILGWGVEDGYDYWLCKNSWGEGWGDDTFFKIKMGDCGIDEYLTTCRPLV